MINNKNKIIILRHGETAFNAHGSNVQHYNIPLNEIGIRQAKEVARLLSVHSINQILTSKLERAINTGDIVANHLGINKIIQHELFNERDQGILKGLTYEEIRSKYPEYWDFERSSINFHIRPDGGENLDDLMIRVDKAIQLINTLDSDTLIVSHKGFIRCLIAKIRNITDESEIAKIQLPNCIFFELN